jgi:hypothetical protein
MLLSFMYCWGEAVLSAMCAMESAACIQHESTFCFTFPTSFNLCYGFIFYLVHYHSFVLFFRVGIATFACGHSPPLQSLLTGFWLHITGHAVSSSCLRAWCTGIATLLLMFPATTVDLPCLWLGRTSEFCYSLT